MKTLVIGANGQIGRQFCALAVEARLPLRAMIRDPGQADDFSRLGVETVVGDLEGEFEQALEDCEQVLFTAGSGPHTGADKTLLVDLYGAIRAIDLARESGLGRFVMVSAMRADFPMAGPLALRPYLAAKYAADQYLRHAGIEYVILKPGRLTDDAPSGRITTDPESVEHNTVSRGNVALSLLAVCRNRALRNRETILLDGDQPIDTVFA